MKYCNVTELEKDETNVNDLAQLTWWNIVM